MRQRVATRAGSGSTHSDASCGACMRVAAHGSARRVRQRVAAARGHSGAWHGVRQRAAARRGSVRGVARERGASFAARKQQLRRARCAHGSGSAVAHRQRHGLQVVAAAFCASVGRSPPASANVSTSLKRGAHGLFSSPAHCTARDALAHLWCSSDGAQSYVICFAKAGARCAGGAPPASENKRLWPGRGGRARYGGKNARGG